MWLQFNSIAVQAACFDNLVQANMRNKKILKEAVHNISAKGITNYKDGFELAFAQLSSVCVWWGGGGCICVHVCVFMLGIRYCPLLVILDTTTSFQLSVTELYNFNLFPLIHTNTKCVVV